MLRKIIIVLVLLTVAVLPLTATGVLAADGTQQNAQQSARVRLALPFVGSFSGKSQVRSGGTSDVGTGLFTWSGWSVVQGIQITGTQHPQPYQMTITTMKGDAISLHVQPGSGTYQIDGGTGWFGHVTGGSGHFSLQRSLNGQQGTFSGHLEGTIVFAF